MIINHKRVELMLLNFFVIKYVTTYIIIMCDIQEPNLIFVPSSSICNNLSNLLRDFIKINIL